MIDKYTIKSAYPDSMTTCNEINILSDNLIYSEIGYSHVGCQSNNPDNDDKILGICTRISELIKELDLLTKKPTENGSRSTSI